MRVMLNLERLIIEDKTEAMEALCRGLSLLDGLASPVWHGEVLEARDREGGEPSDWNEARERIRKRACGAGLPVRSFACKKAIDGA